MQAYIIYIISAISIVLGFIALLKQKTYLDSKTSKPTSIEVSKIGKMKTNYPALVFVFLGFALAVFGMVTLNRDIQNKSSPTKVPWTIRGTLKNPGFVGVEDWSAFTIELVEPDIKYDIPDNGKYEIRFNLDSGQTPEDKFNRLEFTDGNGKYINIEPIFLKEELSNYEKKLKSKLRKTDNELS